MVGTFDDDDVVTNKHSNPPTPTNINPSRTNHHDLDVVVVVIHPLGCVTAAATPNHQPQHPIN